MNYKGLDFELPNDAEVVFYNEYDESVAFAKVEDGKVLVRTYPDSVWKSSRWTDINDLKNHRYNEVLWQREPKYKEFLNSKDGYKLIMLPEHAGDDEKSGLIEVPEGAECAVKYPEIITFYKDEFRMFNNEYSDGYWMESNSNHKPKKTIWQRHTQPEELPFIDDEVNHPTHYTKHPSGIECITITRHHDFAIGNAIKYLWRAGLKDSDNEIQDLEKAVWYINDKIEQLKNAK